MHISDFDTWFETERLTRSHVSIADQMKECWDNAIEVGKEIAREEYVPDYSESEIEDYERFYDEYESKIDDFESAYADIEEVKDIIRDNEGCDPAEVLNLIRNVLGC